MADVERSNSFVSAFSLPEDISKIVEDAWSKLFVAVNSDALGAQFFPIFSENEESFRPLGEKKKDRIWQINETGI